MEETLTYKKCTIEIHRDEDPQNPRTDYDNAGTMLCRHPRYILGDREREDPEPAADDILAITQRQDVIWLPLYLLDHSGITMRSGPANAWGSKSGAFPEDGGGNWDTSCVGVLYITKDDAVKEWGGKRFTKAVYDKAVTYLAGEVKTYAAYLEGDVCGFIAKDPDGETIDSCWGFYPDENFRDHYGFGYMVSEAKRAIDCWRDDRAKQLKADRTRTALLTENVRCMTGA